MLTTDTSGSCSIRGYFEDGGRDSVLFRVRLKSDIIEDVAEISTSEVEGLDDSGTVLLYVCIQMFLFIIIFVVAIKNVFLLE